MVESNGMRRLPQIKKETVADVVKMMLDTGLKNDSIIRFLKYQPDIMLYVAEAYGFIKGRMDSFCVSDLFAFVYTIFILIEYQIKHNDENLKSVMDYISFIGSKKELYFKDGEFSEKMAAENTAQILRDFLRQVR